MMDIPDYRSWVLAALTARFAKNFFDDMLVQGQAKPFFPALEQDVATHGRLSEAEQQQVVSRRLSDILDGFDGQQDPPSEPEVRKVLTWLYQTAPFSNATLESFDASFTQKLMLPTFRYHDLPCYHSQQERSAALSATAQWYKTMAELDLDTTDESLGAIFDAYNHWVRESKLMVILMRCLAPGHGGSWYDAAGDNAC